MKFKHKPILLLPVLLLGAFLSLYSYAGAQQKLQKKTLDALMLKEDVSPGKGAKSDTVLNKFRFTQVQSPFYDAMALYYLANGLKVYPLLLGKKAGGQSTGLSDDTSFNTKGTGPPFLPSPDTLHFQLVECATGKIVLDTVAVLQDVLQDSASYWFGPSDGTTRKDAMYSILIRYVNKTLTGNADDDVSNAYADNPYLSNLPSLATAEIRPDMAHIAKSAPVLTSLFSKEGGAGPSWQTNLISGYTDFLIERVNAEIDDVFLVHLKKALDSVPEFRILFPATLESLTKIQVTNYSASLNAVKAAYEADLAGILGHLGDLTELDRYQNLVIKHQELVMLFTAADLLDGVQKKKNPAQILFELSNRPYVHDIPSNNYNAVIKMASLFSNSLRDIKMGDQNPELAGWIDNDKLTFLKDNPGIFNFFMGLFAQSATGIVFRAQGEQFDFGAALKDPTVMEYVLKGRYILFNVTATIAKIQKIVSGVTAKEGRTIKISDYAGGFLNIADEMLGLSAKTFDVLPSTPGVIRYRNKVVQLKNEWLPALRLADTIVLHIEDKNYQGAIYSANALLQQVLTKKSNELKGEQNYADSLAITYKHSSRDTMRLYKDTANIKKNEQEKVNSFADDFLHYGLFIAAVASAQSASDVKDAITAFALPKGSSRIKKEHKLTVGLNAYVGVYYAKNKSYPGVSLPRTEWGLTAPLGIGVHYGFPVFKAPMSIGLYGGILDVGAIFTYKAEGNELKSEINFGQIFSPSATVVVGFPIIHKYNIPLALGYNVQWGPKLRGVTETGNSVLPLLVKRNSFFLALDLPIVNFYTSHKTVGQR